MEVTGYKVDVVYDNTPYEIAVRSQTFSNGRTIWRLDELKTGLLVKDEFPSRKDAINAINHDLMDRIEAQFESGQMTRFANDLKEFQTKQMAS